MRLISNRPFQNCLAYFVGLDSPSSGGRFDEIAAYNSIKDGSGNLRLKFSGLTFVYYVLFLFEGEKNYLFSIVGGGRVLVEMYDYLGCSESDVEQKRNYILEGTVGGDSNESLEFKFSGPRFVLVKFLLGSDAYFGTDIVFSISPNPISFDYESHFVRDWTNRIDGRSWDKIGKVGHRSNLI